MDENMVLMARRERLRIKQAILRAAKNEGYFAEAGGIRAKVFFASPEMLDVSFNGYSVTERREIVRELTLEIIGELLEGLSETRKRIQAGGEYHP